MSNVRVIGPRLWVAVLLIGVEFSQVQGMGLIKRLERYQAPPKLESQDW
jgi:hypothetical protein